MRVETTVLMCYNTLTTHTTGIKPVVKINTLKYDFISSVGSLLCGWYYTTGFLAELFICGKGIMTRKNEKDTTETFIVKAKNLHGERYDYQYVHYIDSYTDVIIVCDAHGQFTQRPNNHLNGAGCRECGFENKDLFHRMTTEEFISRARLVHGDKYDYGLTNYRNSKEKVTITCPTHGSFEQKAGIHISGGECFKCARKVKSIEDYHNLAKARQFSWVGNSLPPSTTTKTTWRCSRLHEWESSYSKVNSGKGGCPKCRISKGEARVSLFLDSFGIEYERERSFDACRDEKPLPFDFYFCIGDSPFLVEYDGLQHTISVEHWGGEKGLVDRRKKDEIRNNFAQSNGYILIRIPCTIDGVEDYLQNEIEKSIDFSLDRFYRV